MSVESLKRELFRARVFYVLGWLSPIIALTTGYYADDLHSKIPFLGGLFRMPPEHLKCHILPVLLAFICFVSIGYSVSFFMQLMPKLKNDISNLKWAIEKEIERLPEAW